jgi:broad specificity phosphatase PhoE
MTQNNQKEIRSAQRTLQTNHNSELLFVRHTQVAEKYQNVCYGASDVELSAEGERHAREVAESLVERSVERIVHSGLSRARILATHLSELTGVPLEEQNGLRERDFGSWELTSWDDIYTEHGDDMMKMVSEPDKYRPGGSETTREFVERVATAAVEISLNQKTVVVCHGGVIAALTGLTQKISIHEWLDQIPAYGEVRPLPAIDLDHIDIMFQAGSI